MRQEEIEIVNQWKKIHATIVKIYETLVKKASLEIKANKWTHTSSDAATAFTAVLTIIHSIWRILV